MISRIKDIIRRLIGEVPTKTLVKRGLKVGSGFNRQQACFIDPTHCWLISIGNNVTFSIRVILLAHDASTKNSLGYTKIGRICVGDNVFIGANTTILPGVTIGKNSIVGANSLVTKSFPENVVIGGIPARIICNLEDYKSKMEAMMHSQNKIFDKSYVYSRGLSEEKKAEMLEAVDKGIAFIQ